MSATAILNLSKAGFTEAQVTALAEYFDSQMATKAGIAELHVALEKVRGELPMWGCSDAAAGNRLSPGRRCAERRR